MKTDRRQTIKKYVSRLITIVCVGVFIYAAYGLVGIFMDYNQNEKVANDVRETFYDTASAEKKASSKRTKQELSTRPGFDALLKQNPDVAGWITIDDTKIDYPILQSADNQDYLTQDFNKEESIAGSIFLDYRNNIESLSRNTIVYGHRMKDGSMFQHLTKFMDKDFFEKHQTFEIDTLHDSYEAEIFAVYNTTTDLNYIQTDFASDEEYEQFLSTIRNESKYQTDVEVGAADRIITLSTCDYELDENDGRLVVHAKLVKK